MKLEIKASVQFQLPLLILPILAYEIDICQNNSVPWAWSFFPLRHEEWLMKWGLSYPSREIFRIIYDSLPRLEEKKSYLLNWDLFRSLGFFWESDLPLDFRSRRGSNSHGDGESNTTDSHPIQEIIARLLLVLFILVIWPRNSNEIPGIPGPYEW